MQSVDAEIAKRESLLAHYKEVYPGFLDRQPLVRRLLFTWVGLRALYALLTIAVFILMHIPLRPMFYIIQLVSVLVAYFFARIISLSGARPMLYLMLFGGAYSLYKAYVDGVFYALVTESWLYNFSNYAFVASLLLQVAVPLFVMIDAKCRLFSTGMDAVHTDFVQWQKEQRKPAA